MVQEENVIKSFNIVKQKIIEATLFSFFWDCEKMLRENFLYDLADALS